MKCAALTVAITRTSSERPESEEFAACSAALPAACSVVVSGIRLMSGSGGAHYGLYLPTAIQRHRGLSQFDDALVTSCVVTYTKRRPLDDHKVLLSYGDYVTPRDQRYVSRDLLASEEKWVRLFPHHEQPVGTSCSSLGDFFEIRRGIATGSNGFFIRHLSEFAALGISERNLRPILPSPRSMKYKEVHCDSDGWPRDPDPLPCSTARNTTNPVSMLLS